MLEEVKWQGHITVTAKGLKHLNSYLFGYWCMESLWYSWSDYGHQIAAGIAHLMVCSLQQIIWSLLMES